MRAWVDTGATAQLIVMVDDDDPTRSRYPGSPVVGKRQRLAPLLNTGAATVTTPFIGFMGDDVVPRTLHWDAIFCSHLGSLGVNIVYGDDGIQGEKVPTHFFLRRSLVQAIGYLCPPGFSHMFIDDVIGDWGRETHSMRYLPDVSIEHLHPVAGKAEWDASYAETGALLAADQRVYEHYKATQFPIDVAKIRAMLTF
jgi:hypothetical protein